MKPVIIGFSGFVNKFWLNNFYELFLAKNDIKLQKPQ